MLLLLLYLGSVFGQAQIPNIFDVCVLAEEVLEGLIHLILEVRCLRFRDCTRYNQKGVAKEKGVY